MKTGFEAFKVGAHHHGETGAQPPGANLGAKLAEVTAGHQVGEVHGTTINHGDHPTGADYRLPISIIGQFYFEIDLISSSYLQSVNKVCKMFKCYVMITLKICQFRSKLGHQLINSLAHI